MINNVVLVGRLTKPAELKYTSGGTAVTSFTVAVNRQFTNQSGEREADFINCVAWRKTAELIAQYTHKGSMVGIEGRIQTRSYDNQQSQKVYVTEVVTDNVTFLDGKRAEEKKEAPSPDNYSSYRQNTPQAKNEANYNTSTPNYNSSHGMDISDDDLPF
ncbi:single-stranded DNA-binding protein [Desemzia sp. C1]|uniref:single-stranded DNA-binding protein n=1 Tax=Desemzia sp. C1 TaxID=2892016 RepID=UPI001E3CA91E|nr:single-stranded DNA-binding protein [Desemzia sp. C1]MCI3027705.1 single-stranded DNA-binding protein [Desemzia sp. C1]